MDSLHPRIDSLITSKATGVLISLSSVYKYGQRDYLMKAAPKLVPVCEMLMGGKSRFSSNAVIRKLCIKLVQRLGLSFLKPKVAKWRYKRGILLRDFLKRITPNP